MRNERPISNKPVILPVRQEGEYSRPQPSILRELRIRIPRRPNVTYSEALVIAELQAATLLELCEVDAAPVLSEIVTNLPKVRVERAFQSASGASFWDRERSEWTIYLNRGDPRRRRRFTLLHEFKHIIDYGYRHVLYAGPGHGESDIEAERAADYFAGCVLVPKKFLKRAWGNGIQKVTDLAHLFRVSEVAIEVRLRQTGLVDCSHREESGVVRHAMGWAVNCQGRHGGSWWQDALNVDLVRSLQ